MLNEAFLTEFKRCLPELETRRAHLEATLIQLLKSEGIEFQFVSSRVKSLESLRRKLSRPDKTYSELWHVTDLIGLRIATYFEDSTERIARVIERAFTVDLAHSARRDHFNEQGGFGYRSVHYVCRTDADVSFEIQVRTSLQHAWAEVEHDLGYKPTEAVPESIRRRFSRIASLLEIADDEFVAIRQALAQYRTSASAALADPQASLPLDVVTLRELVNDPRVSAVDAEIAALLKKPTDSALFREGYLVRLLCGAGLDTTRGVLEALSTHGASLGALVRPYFDFAQAMWAMNLQNLETVPRGYALFFLAHAAVLRSQELELAKVSRLAKIYTALDYPGDEAKAQSVASGLVAALRKR